MTAQRRYGVAQGGDPGGQGIVYQLSPPKAQGQPWTSKIIAQFNYGGSDLGEPTGTLVIDGQGNLYGTAEYGGLGCGGVFELSLSQGSWIITDLHLFDPTQGEGCYPQSGLIADSAGNLYGTTDGGTVNGGNGTVFTLSQSGGNWAFHVVHAFKSGYDGANPLGNLVISKGALFGATEEGGDSGCGGYGCGIVYEISRSGGYKVIYRFREGTLNGIRPASGLSADLLGNLYGTTLLGGIDTECPYVGTQGCGTVYQLSYPGGEGSQWNERMLYAFTGFNGDGALPVGNVLWTKKGVLYGTTSQGGNDNCSTFDTVGCGIVFALTK